MTTTLELLSWGANSHHQLGIGVECEQCVTPTAVNLNVDNAVKKITGGAGHSIILTDKGKVYSCGLNNRGQAGAPEGIKYLTKFEKILELEDEVIVDVACGWDSSIAINTRGDLFAWGSNAFGQLGVDSPNALYTPTKVNDTLDPIIKIAMGLRHSVLVTDRGNVLVSGDGTKCQLGLTGEKCAGKNARAFTEVPELFGIRNVACGQNHTMVLTNDGHLYGWGDNKHGQIGIDNRICKRIEKPTRIENFNLDGHNGDIFTGWTHTAVLFDGKILSWGRNSYGQLGRGDSTKCETWLPELVQTSGSKFVQLAIGSEHNISLTEDGSIVSWGWNEHGNCGNGSVEDVKYPNFVKISKSMRGTLIGTGYGHSFALVKKLI